MSESGTSTWLCTTKRSGNRPARLLHLSWKREVLKQRSYTGPNARGHVKYYSDCTVDVEETGNSLVIRDFHRKSMCPPSSAQQLPASPCP
jgi:hypothetical protein